MPDQETVAVILAAIIPVFLVIGVGFFMQKKGWLGEKMETGVMRLGLNLLVPCLILTKVPGNPALKTISSAAWALGVGFFIILIGFGVAWAIGHVFRMKRGEGLRTFIITSGIQNYGFIPLPLVIKLFPDNPGPAGLIFVHGLGVELAMWTVGLWVLSRRSGFKSAINGPFIAVVLSLVLNYTGLHEFIPGIVRTAMEMLAQCAIPMAIFMIGATMGRFFKREILNDAVRASVASCVVRLGIVSAIMVALAVYLPISLDFKRVLIVQAAMPVAIFPIVLARLYDGHPQTAIQVVLATSVVSLFTSPIVIALGLQWIGS